MPLTRQFPHFLLVPATQHVRCGWTGRAPLHRVHGGGCSQIAPKLGLGFARRCRWSRLVGPVWICVLVLSPGLISKLSAQSSPTNIYSGYAVTGANGSVTDVKGSWIVPTVTCSGKETTYSSSWVGIDGVGINVQPPTIEQIGTESDCINGTAQNYAWWYIGAAPAGGHVKIPTVTIPTVTTGSGGHTISAEVSFSGSEFTATLTDETTRQSSPPEIGKLPGAHQSTAECIFEWSHNTTAPGPLANFGTALFGSDFTGSLPCTATVGGQTGPIGAFFPISIVMTSYKGNEANVTGPPWAIPSPLSSDGGSFSVVGPFTTFDVGAATGMLQGTFGTAIDPAGDVSGVYLDGASVAHGFFRTAPGTMSTFDAPDAGTGPLHGTYPIRINSAGTATGIYIDDANNHEGLGAYHGFERAAGGGMSEFDVPGASMNGSHGTTPMGIDTAGDIVGFFPDMNFVHHGFLRDAGGGISPFDVPDASMDFDDGTLPVNMNSKGDITGFYVDEMLGFHGFVLGVDDGIPVTIDIPDAGTSGGAMSPLDIAGTAPLAIDTAGDITGLYTDGKGLRHGFVRTADGTFIYPIDAPSFGTVAGPVQGTLPLSINTAGTIAGTFQDDTPGFMGVFHGFKKATGVPMVAPIDAPGANTSNTGMFRGTASLSINDCGYITGGFVDANGTIHGYVLAPLPLAAPTFSEPSGRYTSPLTVTISSTIPSATIYYTTDRSVPTTASPQYTGPILVSSTQTILATAIVCGNAGSFVASATYVFGTEAATPLFSEPSGTYNGAQTVTISDATTGAAIYYTTDGTTPTTSSTLSTGPIKVSATETIEAIASATGYSTSRLATATYKITLPTASTSVASSLNPSTFGAAVKFSATVTSSGGTPSGTVTFKDGSSTLGTGALSSGKASFSISTLALGSHSITAVYGGSTDFAGSTSPVLHQTVKQASSSSSLTSSLNPSTFRAAAKFTATVMSSGGTPSGTVTFKNGAATVGTGTLSSFLLPTSIMGESPSSSLPLDPLRVSIPSRE